MGFKLTSTILMITLWLASGVLPGSQGEVSVNEPRAVPLRVMQDNPTLSWVIKSLGGSQVEIVSYSDPLADQSPVEPVDLFVLGNSQANPWENQVKIQNPEVPVVDLEQYKEKGASLFSSEDLGEIQDGYYIGIQNVKAIIDTVSEALIRSGVEAKLVMNNRIRMIEEIDAVELTGRQILTDMERQNSTWVAATPGAVYVIRNLGLQVGDVWPDINSPNYDNDLFDIENRLRSTSYAGVILPLYLKGSELDEKITALSKDANFPIAYVTAGGFDNDSTFVSNLSYDMASIVAAATRSTALKESTSKIDYASGKSNMTWALIVFALLIYVVLLNKQLYFSGRPAHAPNPIAGKKKKR
ncbi:MAG TPA: hypothetical protein VGB30_07330 [bacterium]|jgi:hypothetical protein